MEDSLIHLTARESPGFQAGRAAPRLTGTAARAGAGLLASALLLASTCAFAQAAPAVLAGLSLGGLFGAYALFHDPEAFSGYLMLSPSLWWDKAVAFDWEQANAKTGRPLRARACLSAGQNEETSGDDAAMISNMKRLAAALSARAAGPLVVKSEVIENEDHYSVFGAAFSRGRRFVLALPDSAATKSN